MLRNIDKHERLPMHDLHVGQHVMYQDSVTSDGIQLSLQAFVKKGKAVR